MASTRRQLDSPGTRWRYVHFLSDVQCRMHSAVGVALIRNVFWVCDDRHLVPPRRKRRPSREANALSRGDLAPAGPH